MRKLILGGALVAALAMPAGASADPTPTDEKNAQTSVSLPPLHSHPFRWQILGAARSHGRNRRKGWISKLRISGIAVVDVQSTGLHRSSIRG